MAAAAAQPARGLTAAELAAACAELQPLAGATVVDAVTVARTTTERDLVLVLERERPRGPAVDADAARDADGAGKTFLHIVTGGPTARLCTTTRRWPKGTMVSAGRLALVGARLAAVDAVPGERIARLRFLTGDGERTLIAELFGPRGLLVLTDEAGRVLHLSRPLQTATRRLAEGERYVPPPPAPAAPAAPAQPNRFAAPVLAAIDAHFRPLDELAETRDDLDTLARAAQRALHKAHTKVEALAQQLADVGRAQALRERADLMLAYAHTVRRGAAAMTVPDPARDGEHLTIELDPARPVVVQGQALYEKARRLDDARAITAERLARAEAEHAALQAVAAAIASCTPDDPGLAGALVPLRAELRRLGALPKAAKPPTAKPGRPARDDARGENVRRFVSAEGYPIWVGRNNEQNDRLTMRLANGNDLWLHVGGGRAGSHVVVRLPKQKTASLETLLDAGTLAVHFSKARGESRIDVVYTLKKHVRKPKGLPAGAVVPSHTKTITVLRDEARLRRLLDSGGDGAAD